MSDQLSAREGATNNVVSLNRRTLLKAGAWAAPVIVLAAAVPVASASTDTEPVTTNPTGTSPIDKLRIGNFRVEDRKQWDAATKTSRGPIAIYVNAFYDRNIVSSDPATATIPWTLTVDGPEPGNLAGVLVVEKNRTQENLVWHLDQKYPLTPGVYTFVFTIYASDGSTSKTASVTIT